MRAFKIYCLSSLQMHNAALLTTVATPHMPTTDWL